MMIDKEILLAHASRYPKMQIEDFVKLIYQQTFGPRHMHDTPDINKVKAYLKDELEQAVYHDETPFLEAIGGGFYRVSLNAIKTGKITLDTLAKQFLSSMRLSPPFNDETKAVFKQKLQDLLEMIKAKELALDEASCQMFIEHYLNNGIKPTHHAKVYKAHYHPHYRVIKEELILASLKN